MNGYIQSILFLSVCSALLTSLLSESSLKKYVEYISRIALVIAVLSPLRSVVGKVSAIKENVNNFISSIYTQEIEYKTNEIIINTTSEKVCEKIKDMVIEKFGFDENEVFVSLELENENPEKIIIKKINIILTHKASWSDTDKVKDYVENLVGVSVYVTKK